ncbi:MAG: AAA family ATPase [Flexistipes sinusarabici]|uniref:AAA family ATPase n=1 Tax=Flexistipes sinusarabici TaxID=2352 RepID=A0A5D0MXT0_FLESI|nr:AAA family ATPase [Flexistipes sinusarabici]TYB36987.1 MAG: AAA family ATPase [Flexistipes sinusarabici]
MSVKEFFQIKELPFNNAPDLKYYYSSKPHQETLTRLRHVIENRKGFALVTGQIGTGKTTLARLLFEELDPQLYETVLMIVVHSEITSEWILKKICTQMEVENIPSDKPGMLTALYKRLYELNEKGKKAVILIDEAQMLKHRDIMEEIRGILNFEDESGKLLTFIFFGLPELENNLSMDEPLKQRVALKCELKQLDFESTKNYIMHRIKVSGAKYNFFADDAYRSIFEASVGIPRVINTICDNAMFESYLIKEKVIKKETVDQVANDLGLLAL